MLGLKGGVFLAVVAVVFQATPYSNLFFLLLSFLVVLGALGLWWTIANLRGLEVQLAPLAAMPSGSRAEVQLGFAAGRRRRFQVVCRLLLDDSGTALGTFGLLHGEAVRTAPIGPLGRGVHALRQLVLTSRYPFGIFECTRTVPLDGELVVYPTPPTLTHTRHGGMAGAGQVARAGAGRAEARPASVRPWRQGDGMRAVHWKASARRTQLVVREHEPESDRGVEVVLDRRAAGEAFEAALGTIAGLLLQLGQGAGRLRLSTQGHTAVYGRGERDAAEGLRWLAMAQPLPGDAAPPPPGHGSAMQLPARGERRWHG